MRDVWNVLLAFLSPASFKKAVDQMQNHLLVLHEQKVRETIQAREAEAKKPKLTLINPNGFKGVAVALLVALALVGCVSTKRYKDERVKMYNEGYEAANFECLSLQQKIAPYLKSLQDRLRLYNQIDPKGNLYPEKPFWNGTKDDKPGEGS